MSRVYRVRETYLCGEYLNECWRTRNSRLWERSQDFDFVVKNSYRSVHNPVQAGRHLPAGHTQIRFLSRKSRSKAIEYIEGFSNFSVPHGTTGRWFPSTNRSRRCPNRKSLWVGAPQTCWPGKHIQPRSILFNNTQSRCLLEIQRLSQYFQQFFLHQTHVERPSAGPC